MHTARRVLSTPSVVLPGYSPPPILTWLGGVVPDQGTPQQGTPLAGYPPAGYLLPGWTWQGTPPLAGPSRVPSPWCLPHGILGNVAKHYGIWVPPPRCQQTENITFPILRMRAVTKRMNAQLRKTSNAVLLSLAGMHQRGTDTIKGHGLGLIHPIGNRAALVVLL